MCPVDELVVLIGGVVPVTVNEAVVRAGAGPVLLLLQDLHFKLNISLI